jgi:putative protease
MAVRAPEVLAPAGDRASLEAAVRAGADAVYFGLQGFNARARADNFAADALRETIELLHRHGVRGYVTLNTLVFDHELAEVERAILRCEESGADAIIVQDLGLMRLARKVAPALPIHASTQMTCSDAGAVELARALGASRVILARELSLADIAAIREQTSAELEVFVHGALCIAYSGQCLTSEAIGGRSANRGACAQACRLPYELVVDGRLRELGDLSYLLSPQDLEASALVPELCALGVSSLKIEGRLKGPEYVAATTALYRKAVDAAVRRRAGPIDQDRALALQTFNRGAGPGFLRGIDHQRLVEARGCDHRGLEVGVAKGCTTVRGRRELELVLSAPLARGDGIVVEGGRAGEGEIGGRVWAIARAGMDVDGATSGETVEVWLGPERSIAEVVAGRRIFKSNDPRAERVARAIAEQGRRRLDVRISGVMGSAPSLEGSSGAARARVTLAAPLEPAHGAGIDAAVLRAKLGKLGDTPFELGELVVDLPARAHLPLSLLNRARRELIDALLAATQPVRLEQPSRPEAARGTSSPIAPPGLYVLCRTLEQAEAAVEAGAAGVYLDFLELTGTGRAVEALRARGVAWIGLAPPRIRKPGEERIDRYLASLAPEAMLVRGLGALFDADPCFLREGSSPSTPWLRIGDFSLNVANRLGAREVLSRGLSAFTPSFDLDSSQLCQLASGELAPLAEVVVHHPMPLFHMEHCVIAALLSSGRDHKTCGRPCERHQLSLRDRAGMDHPVEADVGCRNTVFHARAQSAAELVPSLQKQGVQRFRVELVREDATRAAAIVAAYRKLLAASVEPRTVWRELKSEQGYGVVRGSLRVLNER